MKTTIVPMHALNKPSRTLIVAITAALMLWAPSVAASPLFELVGSGYGTGGQNARVAGPSAASAYFNPSLLPKANPGLNLGFFYLAQQISIRLQQRSLSPLCRMQACDVPEVAGAGPESFRHGDGSPLAAPTLPTAWLNQGRENDLPPRRRQQAGSGVQSHPYALLGLVLPVFDEHLVVGLHTMIPMDHYTSANAFYNDEREQFFSNSLHPELYGDRLTATSLAVGFGSQILEGLAFGMAFTISLKNSAQAPVYVFNLSDLDTLLLDSNVEVLATVSPHFGLTFEPLKRWRLSATAHSPQKLQIDTSFTYLIASGIEQGAGVAFTHDYLPWTFALGSELTLVDDGLRQFSAVGTVKWALWSDYTDRHSETPSGDWQWSDTLEVAAGLRYAQGATRTFLDMVIAPSPVPAQVGRTNYVDSDRYGWSAGVDHEFELWGAKLRAGLQAQFHLLVKNVVWKHPGLITDEVPDDAVGGIPRGPIPGREGLQTNNPGFPGYRSFGWLLGGGANIELIY